MKNARCLKHKNHIASIVFSLLFLALTCGADAGQTINCPASAAPIYVYIAVESNPPAPTPAPAPAPNINTPTPISISAPTPTLNSTSAHVLPTYEQCIAPIRIAIIDTGINTGRLDTSKILEGKNYIVPDAPTTDLIGHGTRVASLILGADDGSKALAGCAPEAALIPLVYSTKLPSGTPICGGAGMIAKCVRDAVDVYGCRVICISSGVAYNDADLESAVAHAEENGAVVVAAVGNDNTRAPDRVYYPAAYKTVVGVGSVGPGHDISPFSQRSAPVDIYAPGEEVTAVSIKNAEFYETISGTSYAAAQICGAAARILAESPELTPAAVRDALLMK